MKEKNYTKEEIDKILEKNKLLEEQNKYLKKLVDSKRFKFAEKIATKYNLIFPKNTLRRKIFNNIVRKLANILNIKENLKRKKIQNKIKLILNDNKKTIIIDSILWEVELQQRSHHLAYRLNEVGFNVIYLEQAITKQYIKKIKDGLFVINNRKLLIELPKNRKAYYLLPSMTSVEIDFLKRIKNMGYDLIYDYIDEFHEHISEEVPNLLEVWNRLEELKPVLAIASAKKLYLELEEKLGKNSNLLLAQNAVNIEHFDYKKHSELDTPKDLEKIIKSGKKIVGYYGAMAPWIDYNLLNNLSKNNPELEFVYIGIDYGGALKNLKIRKNVHMLGAKKYNELINYSSKFDCAIIPFVRGPIAKATSPVKLFEYMATGLPTVCTGDLEECKGYKHVYISKNDADFEKNIYKAIEAKNNEKVRDELFKQANEHTWKKRAEAIKKSLN